MIDVAPSIPLADRAVVLPFIMCAFPAFWFLRRAAAPPAQYLAAAAGCLVVAVVVAAFAPSRPASPLLRAAVRPGDATLVVLSAVLAGGLLYLGLDAGATPFPRPIDAVARPLGVWLGLPLLAALWLSYRVGDRVGAPSIVTQSAAVAVGLALTAVWVFALATVLGRVVSAAR